MKKTLIVVFSVIVSVCVFAAFFEGYTANAEEKIFTLEDMIETDAMYDGYGSTANKLKESNGVVASSGAGKFVVNAEMSSVSLNVRFMSGASVFFVLRGSDDKACWDGGRGYFAMVNKNGSAVGVQMIEGAASGNAFVSLGQSKNSLSANLFDGEKHKVVFTSTDDGGKVKLSFSIDGEEITSESKDNVFPVSGSHFFIAHGQGVAVSTYKLYTENGVDVTPGEGTTDYSTVTSKTLLNKSGNWTIQGARLTVGEKIEGNRDSSIAMFSRELTNVLYSFEMDIDETKLADNWIAVLLNANKADMVWNNGFKSVCLFIRKESVSIEFWQPQTAIGSVSLTESDISLSEPLRIKTGIYDLKISDKTYKFLKLEINGKTLYDEQIVDPTMCGAGFFGIINFGTAEYSFNATETEEDKIPSVSTGEKEEKPESISFANDINADDFAVIANSVNPTMRTDGDVTTVENDCYITYKNSVNFTNFKFSLKFLNSAVPGETAEFGFGKLRQNTFPGITLSNDASNYGYAMRIDPQGIITVVKTTSGEGYKTLMSFDVAGDYGVNFSDGRYHTFTLVREFDGEKPKFTVYVDELKFGCSVTDTDYYAPNYPLDGFITFGDTADGGGFSIKEIAYDGSETNVCSSLEADAVNFPSYFERGDKKFVFVCFDSASYTTKRAEVYKSDANGTKGELIGKIFPGETTLDVSSVDCDYALVVSVGFTENGNKTSLLKLEEAVAPFEGKTARKIKIQSSDGGAYFAYGDTNEKFVPLGGNYMGLRSGDHSTFDAATTFTEADYDSLKAEAMMKHLALNGGNFIRVFLIGRTSMNPGISGDPAYDINDERYYYEGLYKPYMENVTDFLRLAQKYGIYVMLALGDGEVPSNAYYLALQGGQALGRNGMYFTENGINARKIYASNVAKYLKNYASDCINAVLSVEVQNEFCVYGEQAPFNMTSGNWTSADGKKYDMSNPDAREEAYKNGVTYYINTVTAAIKEILPDMLVNEGTFTRNIVGNNDAYGIPASSSGDARYPATLDTYLSTDIDFIDLHIYFAAVKGNTVLSSFTDDLTYMNFYKKTTQNLLKKKCILMGEFGPDTRNFPTYEEAHESWTQTVRLAKEAGFAGFAAWTLESHNQISCWNLMTEDGSFELFRELVRLMLGVENTDAVFADDVTVKIGEKINAVLYGTVDGDVITFSLDGKDYSEDIVPFGKEGEYTVYFRVERKYADTFNGSFKVNVTSEKQPASSSDGSSSKGGCGGSMGVYSCFVTVLSMAGTVLALKKKKE